MYTVKNIQQTYLGILHLKCLIELVLRRRNSFRKESVYRNNTSRSLKATSVSLCLNIKHKIRRRLWVFVINAPGYI